MDHDRRTEAGEREAAEGRHAVSEGDAHSLSFDELERFAVLVLEEAAKVCDGVNNYSSPMTANDCADEIRSLKPKGEE